MFHVVGHRGKRLQVESKSTIAGYSTVNGYDWESGNARLKTVRKANNFNLFARGLDTEDWVQVNHFERPDLPNTLELSLISYACSYGAGRHDLIAIFSDLSIY